MATITTKSTESTEKKRLLTITQASNQFGVDRKYLKNLVSSGKIPGQKFHDTGRWYVRYEDINRRINPNADRMTPAEEVAAAAMHGI